MSEFILYEDMSEISDSMLLDSGTEIAEYRDPENDIYLSIEVQGAVSVEYLGKVYHKPSEFPEGLISLISEDPLNLWYNEAVSVNLNNWFALIEWEKNEQGVLEYKADTVIDIENHTQEQIKDVFEDYANDIKKNRELEEDRDER